MSSISTIPSSPNSFQLRLRSKYRKKPFPLLFFHTHLPNFDRRVRLIVSSSSSSSSGSVIKDGNEIPGGAGDNKNPQNSWINTTDESFSGWFGTDSNGSGSKKSSRVFVGAGVAGVVLAAGVAFASISLSKSNASGHKQQIQMEPITAQNEMLLASDDQNDQVEQVKGDDTARPDEGDPQDGHNPENKTGIDNVFPTSPEITDTPSESNLDEDMSLETSLTPNDEYTTNEVNEISNAPLQEDLQSRSKLDDLPVPSDSNASLAEIPESLTDARPNASSSENSEDHLDVGTLESTVEPEENLDIPVVSAANSTDIETDEQKEISDSTNRENSESPSEFSSASDGQISSDLSALDNSANPESDPILDLNVKSEDDVENVSSISARDDLNFVEPLQKTEEGNLPLEQHNLNENGSPAVVSTTVVADPFANETDTTREFDTSNSFFALSMPENSFSSAGIPAPSLVSAALQVPPGKVLIPAVVDQVQGQALAALQVLKVIEADVQPTDLCTRREYARWLVSSSSLLSRNSLSKVYPAMYIENVTDLAFDDITPEDPDFAVIQGLAEAGLISSKLSRRDELNSLDEEQDLLYFSPESPLSRQDLVTWKMALDKRQLPEVDRKIMQQFCGFIDIDKINPDAWPALVADQSAGEQGITTLAFGYTRLFQPDKPVTKAQAAIAIATGDAADMVSEELARIEAESMAETAVAAHTALVAQVEKDINSNFKKELAIEKEKVDAIEKLAEETRLELEKLRAEREEENNTLRNSRAAIESEMEILSTLRRELDEQLQSVMSNKTEISFERERINKLRLEAETENQAITRLQYELEVERKALSIARTWAEDEAKKAREHAKSLEEARDRLKKHGIQVVVDSDLQDDATAEVTWLTAAKESETNESVKRAENLVDRLKEMASKIKGSSRVVIEKIIQKVNSIISVLKEWAIHVANRAKELQSSATSKAKEFQTTATSKASESVRELQSSANGFSTSIKEGATRIAGDCKEGVEKITQKFKTA